METDFDPNTLNYAQLEDRRRATSLCGGCRHREVCPVPRALEKRAGWFLAIGNCGHFEKEKTNGDGTPRTDG